MAKIEYMGEGNAPTETENNPTLKSTPQQAVAELMRQRGVTERPSEAAVKGARSGQTSEAAQKAAQLPTSPGIYKPGHESLRAGEEEAEEYLRQAVAASAANIDPGTNYNPADDVRQAMQGFYQETDPHRQTSQSAGSGFSPEHPFADTSGRLPQAEIGPDQVVFQMRPPVLRGLEQYTVTGPQGPIRILMDPDPDVRWPALRRLLTGIEGTIYPDGGLQFREANTQEQFNIMALQGKDFLDRARGTPQENLGAELVAEFQARTAVHAAYLKFLLANEVGQAIEPLRELDSKVFNFFFRNQDFIDALQYLEDHALDYITTDFSGREKFGAQMIGALASSHGSTDTTYWLGIQTNAVRMWELSGRVGELDRIDPTGDRNGGKKNKFMNQSPTKGSQQLRKVMSFHAWVTDNAPGDGFYPELIEGLVEDKKVMMPDIDINSRSFLVDIVDSFLPANMPKEQKESLIQGWRKGEKIDFSLVNNWQAVDFYSSYGVHPTEKIWTLANVTKPEGARVAMTENAESFLRNPNEDSLKKLIDAFNYPMIDRWKVKLALTERFLHFVRFLNEKKTGRKNYDLERLDAIVNDLTGYLDPKAPKFNRLEDREPLRARIYSKEDLWQRLKANKGVKVTAATLLAYLWGVVTGIWKAVTGGKG